MFRLIPFIAFLAVISSIPLSQAASDTVTIPVAENFAKDGTVSRLKQAPLLVMVSQHHCPFCERIKHDVLHPMIIAGDYKNQLLMRELFLDQGGEVTDFYGKRHHPAAIARSYGVDLTPTLLFLGPEGEELSERIIGYYTPEMFFYYVDQAIKRAIETLTPDM